MYIWSIAAFFGITVVGVDFRSVLQWQDIKPSPYICFSDSNVDIVALLKPATINTSFCVDGIAAMEKNSAIF